MISIHAPLRGGRPIQKRLFTDRFCISIHAPPARGATCIATWIGYRKWDFNPRPPARGATLVDGCGLFSPGFQSTPPCAGGDIAAFPFERILIISIHAPLRGGRRRSCAFMTHTPKFQSTPPCAGGDDSVQRAKNATQDFNPRPPARGATFHDSCDTMADIFQSTPPCAGGD